jgi:hypothetical protein
MIGMHIEWIDHGREPQCAPDPNYPEGKDVDCGVEQSCLTPLPYPAKRCGLFVVTCYACGARVAVTTAGRPDDPRSVKLPCEQHGLQWVKTL